MSRGKRHELYLESPRTQPGRLREKTCTRCGTRKPGTSFVRDRTRVTGLFPWCKDCVRETRREDRAVRVIGEEGERKCPGCLVGLEGTHANRLYCSVQCKDRVRRWHVFGLEPDEYRLLIASTGGRCPICEKKVKRWVLDHDHETGETTGPTCQMCNQNLLGYTYHDLDTARRLLAFLENPPVRAMFGERRYVGPDMVSQLHRMWAWSGGSEDAARERYDEMIAGKRLPQATSTSP